MWNVLTVKASNHIQHGLRGRFPALLSPPAAAAAHPRLECPRGRQQGLTRERRVLSQYVQVFPGPDVEIENWAMSRDTIAVFLVPSKTGTDLKACIPENRILQSAVPQGNRFIRLIAQTSHCGGLPRVKLPQ